MLYIQRESGGPVGGRRCRSALRVECYEMEVGENRVRVFYGTEKREGERLEIYTGGIGPCSRTVYQTCNIRYICNMEC